MLKGKLVRDLAEEAKNEKLQTLNDTDYLEQLYIMLIKEAERAAKEQTIEALVDMGEVMHGILGFKNTPIQDFQRIRQERMETLGGYEKRYFKAEK
jgi:predicted house-cleaning noncanonical NTP pyrophosphatase (MazG superfamily)